MKRFLIIRFSSLGDILLTIPVYKNIKLAYPDSEISVLTKKQYSEIFNRIKEIDRIIKFEGIFKTYKTLKNEKFDFLIDLHSNLRSFIFRKIIKANRKIKYNKDSLYRRLFVKFKIISPALQKHTVKRYLSALEMLNIPIKTDSISLINFKTSEIKKKIEKPNILVLQTAFLGDLLLTLPLIKQIKKSFPESKLTVLCRSDLSQVLENIVEVDEIIKDNKKTSSYFKELFRLKQEIEKRNFNIAIIPHRSIRSAILSVLAKIKIRIGFDIGIVSFFYTHKVPFSWLMHDVERNISLLSPLSEIADFAFPELKTKKLYDEIDSLRIRIGINPSSVWETKRWPKEKFITLIQKLNMHFNEKIIIFGSKDEIQYNKEIEEKVGANKIINLTGKTDLNALIEKIKKMDIFITNDSGPMHIAVACSIPIVAIFGPTTKELGFFPYSKNSIVIEENLNCRPCKLHGSHKCPHKHFLCMNLITVEKVFKNVIEMINNNQGAIKKHIRGERTVTNNQ